MSNLAAIDLALSSRYWCWKYYTQAECPARLMEVLISGLKHIETSSWAQRFEFGGVYVNGIAVLEDIELIAPCKIEYYEPKYRIEDANQVFPVFSKELIVYEDPDLLIAYKPTGLPSARVKDQRHYSLQAYLERYLGSSLHMPSRIDTSAQGLVVTSRSLRMHARLQRAFEGRRVNKSYRLLVHQTPDWQEKELVAPIGLDPSHPVLRRVCRDGKIAVTKFKVLQNIENNAVLEAQPVTGRTHQIRVHCASLGFPIVGDKFYGGREASSLHLVSYSFEFMHPFLEKRMRFTAPKRLAPEWASF